MTPEKGRPGGSRRRGRALAMKLLYQASLGKKGLDEIAPGFQEYQDAPEGSRRFAGELASGVLAHLDEIDGKIREAVERWEFDRLAAVDLQLMRVAVYELLFCDDVPANVTMDEAIELAREYSAEQSSKFVNGVLDSISRKYAAHKIQGGPRE